MKKLIELKNGEDVFAVNVENEKVYFNGEEVVKISFDFEGGVLVSNPYSFLDFVATAEAGRKLRDEDLQESMSEQWEEMTEEEELIDKYETMREYLEDDFKFYALVYKDKETNKEHLIQNYNGEWLRVGDGSGWDSIDGWHDVEDSDDYVLAYGINDGVKVDSIFIAKINLYYNGYYYE